MPQTTESMKAFLIKVVKEAYPSANTTPNLKENSSILRTLPVVAVRMGVSSESNDEPYGRQLSSTVTGDYEIYNFTLNCFNSNCLDDGVSRNKYALDMADSIKKYMNIHRGAYKISDNVDDIYALSVREANATEDGSGRISRAIITGKLDVSNTDS
jgi:hypothetical protein